MIEIRLLILDQARTTGYAVFDDNSLTEYGTIELGKKDEIYENLLLSAKEKVRDLINKTQADILVIEDIQQQNQNVGTYKKLAMLMGVLICLFHEVNKPYCIVPPTRWKSFAQIKGKKRIEQKSNTMLFVKEKFGLEDVTEDTADAISMGFFAMNTLS